MLLNEFNSPTMVKYAAISKALKSQYGISIKEADEDNLKALSESLSSDIRQYRIENMSPRDPRVAKKLLMLEGVKCLIENIHLERPHRVYKHVLDGMYGCACNMIDIGDDVEDAIKTCMKEYRSSKYRFPDEEIEFDLRNRLNDYISNIGNEVPMGLDI